MEKDEQIGDAEIFIGKQQTALRAQAEPESLIGQEIAGRYKIESIIGRGGMGVVYLASQVTVQRKVVIKVLPRNLKEDDRARRRFEREARGLSSIQHPNIVTLHDFGYERELPYIVMEYVEGQTLGESMRVKRRLGLGEFLPLAGQILSAIGEAHRQGLVHRDIKPDNIMLCERNGRANFVKILDFGLARVINDDEEITQQNLIGTALYLSPEQITGKTIDQRSDVYALGILFYLLLCGRKPFRSTDDVNLLFQHVNNDPEPLALQLPSGHDIPEALINLIHRCLSKNPRDRPFDARTVLQMLKGKVSLEGEEDEKDTGFLSFTTAELTLPKLSDVSGPVSFGGGGRNTDDIALDIGIASVEQITGVNRVIQPQTISQPVTYGALEGDKSSFNPLHFVLVGIILLAIGAGAFFLVSNYQNQGSQDSSQQVLARVETLVVSERFGEAEYLLRSVEEQARQDPDLLVRLANLRERLEVGRLLNDARDAEEAGQVRRAIKVYQKVLKRNATHPDARRNLDRLKRDHPQDMNFATDEALNEGKKSSPKP